MPNHIINEVRLHGIGPNEVCKHFRTETSAVSFRVLLPLPLNFWAYSVGIEHKKAFPGNHLDAAREMWGTKWDAYGDPKVERDGDDTVLTFQTAWSPPRGWVCALFNVTECEITHKWMDEGGIGSHIERYFQGPYDWNWEASKVPEDSDDHRHLHKLMWGVERFDDEDE